MESVSRLSGFYVPKAVNDTLHTAHFPSEHAHSEIHIHTHIGFLPTWIVWLSHTCCDSRSIMRIHAHIRASAIMDLWNACPSTSRKCHCRQKSKTAEHPSTAQWYIRFIYAHCSHFVLCRQCDQCDSTYILSCATLGSNYQCDCKTRIPVAIEDRFTETSTRTVSIRDAEKPACELSGFSDLFFVPQFRKTAHVHVGA